MNAETVQSLRDFVSGSSVQVPVGSFVINLLLAAALSFFLAQIYIGYADSLSNRRLFSRNFLLLTMVTMLIISIVKSSIALSLGLVGALSIVRFRAAIKEPEELVYLFLAIGIGLGLGANQGVITIVAFVIIATIIIIRKHISRKTTDNQNLYLTISSDKRSGVRLENLIERLKENCLAVDLKRFDESEGALEASFLIEFEDYKQLNDTRDVLHQLDNSVSISFLDNRGVV